MAEDEVESVSKVTSAETDKAGKDEVKKFVDEDENFEENLIDEEEGNFSISDTILSVASVIKDKHSSNLENLTNNKKSEDSRWESSDEFNNREEEQNFYNNSSEDLYNESRDSLRQNKNDLYNEKHGGLYSAGSSKNGIYDAGEKRIKSYGELIDNRRSGKSMLEIAGFEDKQKQKNRDMHKLVRYEAKMN